MSQVLCVYSSLGRGLEPIHSQIPDLKQAGSQSPNHIPVASKVLYKEEPESIGPESLSRLRGPTGLHSAQALRASGTGNHKHPQENLLPQKAPSSLCVLRTTCYGPHASRPFHGTARKYHPQQLFSQLYVAEPGRPQKPLQPRNVCRQSQLGTVGGLWVEVPRT